jgi:outer membrane lipoprotein-sorting protein
MRKLISSLVLALLLAAVSAAQDRPAAATQPAANLESVLALMDRTAQSFQSAEADFVWDQFDNVVKEHDKQEGKIFFRRHDKQLQMGAHVIQPQEKFVVYSGDFIQLYEPRINQITKYSTAKNKSQFESFLVLGFGGSGKDLKEKFDVRAVGNENVDGVATTKLELIPKEEKARNVFAKIYLWIDQRGLSVRQMFMEPNSGNYRDALYRNIQLNQKIPDSNFKLKPRGDVKIVTPQG